MEDKKGLEACDVIKIESGNTKDQLSDSLKTTT
jgi:hypothetical protein